MADMDFDEFDAGYAGPQAGVAGRWVNLFGAACSVALVIGVAVWGYKIAVRDVAGVPVVRAVEGPLRVSPDNPGGAVAMHQGLSVNAVASSGVAMPLPETLILAPQDVDLTAEDVPGLAVLSTLDDAGIDIDNAMPVSTLSDGVVTAAPIEVPAMPDVVNPGDMMSSDLAVDQPLPATQEEAVAAALAAALGEDYAADVSAVAVPDLAVTGAATSSLRPRARPEGVAAASLPEGEVALENVAAVNVAEVDPSTIANGTRLVQLGAFDDDAGARADWTRLATKFPELLGTKSMVIQTAVSGGRTFYRLRAYGFDSEDDSRRFCAAFLAENASCIPVSQR